MYDAFGRLRKVYATGTSDLVAEYTYNGLGFRIGWHSDITDDGTTDEPDGVVDAYDPWYWFCYDDGWRIVATFRAADDNPKEVFVHHNAGLGGRGGSSYIDSVILRDRDAGTAWADEADSTREQRVYYCQNWRADVVALLSDSGKMLEWTKYSAYGVPFALPAGDIDSDGDFDSTDVAGTTGAYDVRKDSELDADVDFNDIYHAAGIGAGYQTLGRGVLTSPAIDNRRGYAGYESDPTFAGANGGGAAARTIYHVRHRVYDADVGRWTRRDPLGYVDGMGMYEYARSQSVSRRDPSGLQARNCAGGGCGYPQTVASCPGPPNGADCAAKSSDLTSCLRCCEFRMQTRLDCAAACFHVYDPSIPPQPGGPPIGGCSFADDPTLSDAEICQRYKARCGANDGGGTTCRSGRPVSCLWLPPFAPDTSNLVKNIVESCLRANEDTHHDDVDCNDCLPGSVCRPQFKKGTNKRREECVSDIATIACFNRRKPECDTLLEPDRTLCHEMVQFMLNATCGLAEQHCGVRPSGCQ